MKQTRSRGVHLSTWYTVGQLFSIHDNSGWIYTKDLHGIVNYHVTSVGDMGTNAIY